MNGGEVDRRIVQMEFDNDRFEKGVKETINSLDELKKALDMDKAAKSLDSLDQAVSGSMRSIESSAASMASSLERMLDPIDTFVRHKLESLVSGIESAGERMVRAVSVDAMKDGWSEYEQLIKSTKTMVNMTKNLSQFGGDEQAAYSAVNAQLDQLNEYADRTIYSFNDMTTAYSKFIQNLGSGTTIEQAGEAVKGLFNAAAYYGLDKQQAQRVAYNASQAMGLGYMGMRDWYSFVNAGMASPDFKQRIIDLAKMTGKLDKYGHIVNATGKAARKAVVDVESFNETLQFKWFDKELIAQTFSLYSDETTQLGRDATEAATHVRTVTDMISSLKEALGTGWASTFELIFGDLPTIEKRLTTIKDTLEAIINFTTERRNAAVKNWLGSKLFPYADFDIDENVTNEKLLRRNLVSQGIDPDKKIKISRKEQKNSSKKGSGGGMVEPLGDTVIENAVITLGAPAFLQAFNDAHLGKQPNADELHSHRIYKGTKYVDIGQGAKDLTASVDSFMEAVSNVFGLIDDVNQSIFDGLKIGAAKGDKEAQNNPLLTALGITPESIRKASEGLAGFTGQLRDTFAYGEENSTAQSLTDTFTGIGAVIGLVSDALDPVPGLLADVTNTLMPIADIVLFVTGEASKGLTWIITKIRELEIFDKIAAGISTGLFIIRTVLYTISNIIRAFWPSLKALVGKLKAKVIGKLTDWLGKLKAKFDELKIGEKIRGWFEKLPEKVPKIVEKLSSFFEKFGNVYKKVKTWIAGNKTLQKWKKQFTDWFNGLAETVPQKISAFIEDPSSIFKPIKDFFKNTLVAILSALGVEDPAKKADEIIARVKNIYNKIINFDQTIEEMPKKFEELKESIKKNLTETLTNFLAWIGIEKPEEKATEVVGHLSNTFGKVQEAITTVGNFVNSIFGLVFGETRPGENGEPEQIPFDERLSTRIDAIKTYFEGLKTKIKEKVKDVLVDFLTFLGAEKPDEEAQKVIDSVRGVFGKVNDAITTVTESVTKVWNTIMGKQETQEGAEEQKKGPTVLETIKAKIEEINTNLLELKESFREKVVDALAGILELLKVENPEQTADTIVQNIMATFRSIRDGLAKIPGAISGALKEMFGQSEGEPVEGADQSETFMKKISKQLSKVGTFFVDLQASIKMRLVDVLEGFLAWLGEEDPKGAAQRVTSGLRDALTGVGEVLGSIGEVFTSSIHNFMNADVKAEDGSQLPLAQRIEKRFEAAMEGLPDVIEGVKSGLRHVLEGVLKAVGSDDPASDAQEIIDTIKGIFGKISQLFTTIKDGFARLFGGKDAAGEVAEVEAVLDNAEKNADSLGKKLENTMSRILGIFVSSASAEGIDEESEAVKEIGVSVQNTNKELKDTSKEAEKSPRFIDRMRKGVETTTGFLGNVVDSMSGSEFSIDKFLDILARGGGIIGGTSLAVGFGNFFDGVGDIAKNAAGKRAVFSSGIVGLGQFLQFAMALWGIADAMEKISKLKWWQIAEALGSMATVMALALGGKLWNSKIEKRYGNGTPNASALDIGGLLAFASVFGLALAAIDHLMKVANEYTPEEVEWAMGQFFSILTRLAVTEVVVDGVKVGLSAAMKKFKLMNVDISGLKGVCGAIKDAAIAVLSLGIVKKVLRMDHKQIEEGIFELWEICGSIIGTEFAGGLVGGAVDSFLTSKWDKWKGFNSSFMKGFEEFATGINNIVTAVEKLTVLNLLDEFDGVVYDLVTGEEKMKKVSLVEQSLNHLASIMLTTDLLGALGTFAGGFSQKQEQGAKNIKTFAEAIDLVTGAFVAIVGIEAIAPEDKVAKGLEHLTRLMATLTTTKFFDSLGNAIETAVSGGTGGSLVSARQRIASYAGIAVVLAASVGAFFLLANVVQSFSDEDVEQATSILTPLAILVGAIGSFITVYDKIGSKDLTTGAIGGFNVGAFFIIVYELVKGLASLEGFLSDMLGGDEAVKKTKKNMHNLGEVINSFATGLLGIKDFGDPETLTDFATKLNTFGDKMATVNWDNVNPGLEAMAKFSEIGSRVSSVGQSISDYMHYFGAGIGTAGEGMANAQDAINKVGGVKQEDFNTIWSVLQLFGSMAVKDDYDSLYTMSKNFNEFVQNMVTASENVALIKDVNDVYVLVDTFNKITRLAMDMSSGEGVWDPEKIKEMIQSLNEFGDLAVDKGAFYNAGQIAGQFVKGFSDTASVDQAKVASDALTLIKMYTTSLDTESSNKDGSVWASGKNFVQGYADGIKHYASLATTQAGALGVLTLAALNNSLSVHSPSRETHDIGEAEMQAWIDSITKLGESPEAKNALSQNEKFMEEFNELWKGYGFKDTDGLGIVAELANAIDEDADKPVNSIEGIANNVYNQMYLHKDDLKPVGLMFALGFANGLVSDEALRQARLCAHILAVVAINAARQTGVVHSPSKVMFGIGDYFAQGFAGGLLNRMTSVEKNSGYMAQSVADTMSGTLDAYSLLDAIGLDPNPTIRPVLDLSDIQNKAGELHNILGQFNSSRMAYAGSFGNSIDYGRNIMNNGDLLGTVQNISSTLTDLQNRMDNLQVVLDSGVLVGEITPGIDRALGARSAMSRRGV